MRNTNTALCLCFPTSKRVISHASICRFILLVVWIDHQQPLPYRSHKEAHHPQTPSPLCSNIQTSHTYTTRGVSNPESPRGTFSDRIATLPHHNAHQPQFLPPHHHTVCGACRRIWVVYGWMYACARVCARVCTRVRGSVRV